MDIYHVSKVYVMFDLKEAVAKFYCLGIYTIWLLAKSTIITSAVKFDK